MPNLSPRAMRPGLFLPAVALTAALLPSPGCTTTTTTGAGTASTATATANRPGSAKLQPATVYRLDAPDAWPGDLVLPLRTVGPFRFVKATVNGRPAGRFLLDTGANRTVIDTGVAGRIGLPDNGGGSTVGVAGTASTRYRLAQHVRLGPGRLAGSEDTVLLQIARTRLIGLSLGNLGGTLGAGVGGVAGFTDFVAVPFTIDPQAGTLTLHRPTTFRPPPGATRHRLNGFHGLPVIDADVYDGREKIPVRLLLDTGANNALTLPRKLLEHYPRIASVPVSGAGLQSGVGGTAHSTDTWVRQTKILGLKLRHIPVSFEQMPGALGRATPPLGRLGMGVLGSFRLTFDGRHGYIYATWLPPTAPATPNQ